MARYFFHLRDGTSELLDPEGAEFATLEAMRTAALVTARELIAHDIRDGVLDLRFRLEAESEGGELVYSLPFGSAISIIFPDDILAPDGR